MTRFILITFVLWRVGLFAIAYLAQLVLPTFGDRFPYWQEVLASSGLPIWLWSWGNFDGVHYLTIAKSGYRAQFTQVFFPVYPLTIRLLAGVLGDNFLIAALALSNVFLIVWLILFVRLLSLDGVSKKVVRWTVIFTLLFPFSFFFGSIYNEGLFLTLVLASFMAARKRRWLWSGLFGALASATRLVGIFLLPALIVEWLKQGRFLIRHSKIEIIWLFFVPLGLIAYMWYLAGAFGDPLYFVHAQPVFGASRTGGEFVLFPQVIWRYLKIFATVPVSHYDFWVALWEFGAVGVFFLFCLSYWRKIRASYLTFSLLAVVGPTLTGTFSSMPRYILLAFPLFLMHGLIKETKVKLVLVSVYALLLVIFTSLFTRGYWVS